MTPALITAWMNTQGGGRPAWLDDPLLRATYSPRDIEAHWGDPLRKTTPEAVARARRNFEHDGRNAMMLRGQQVPRTLLAAKWQAQFRPQLAQRQD